MYSVTLVNPNDGITHRLAVYCLDWDPARPGETLDLLNPSTGLSELTGGPVSLSNFSNGTWVVFYFTGNVELQVTNTAASPMRSSRRWPLTTSAPPRPSARRRAPITTAQIVTISTATSGATIRYTTDGTTPSETVGTVYSSPVNITATSTLQAIAYETGYSNSTVASGVYTIHVRRADLHPGGGHL